MDTLISADRLLPGPAGQEVRDGAVLVRGREIVAVGTREELRAAVHPDTRDEHFPGATVLPGLINTHVHLVFDASRDPVGAFRAAAADSLYAAVAERARQLLDGGVTTARDLGDTGGLVFRLRAEIASGDRPGPLLVAAGAPLTPPGGHCWFLGGEVDGNDAIRDRIRDLAAAGSDVIKVMASGGHMTPGSAPMWGSQFDREQLRFIVEEARAVGLPVAAHAHGAEAIADSVAAGVATVEHCTWMTEGMVTAFDDTVAAEMAAHGVYAGDTTPPNWTTLAAMFPAPPGRRFGDRLPWMHASGVPIIIGTDAGMPGAVFDDFATALSLYTDLGFRPDQVLEMVTVTAARALGLAGRTGSLVPGLTADILVVDGDPRESLAALHDQRLVMAAGRVHRADGAA